MARNFEMSWIESRKGWMKEYRGVKYSVSCRQLREQGYAEYMTDDTKKGSYHAANVWWARKREEVDKANRPAPRPLTEVEKLVFAAKCKDPDQWEEAARQMDAAGATPTEIAKLFAEIVREHVLDKKPLTPCLKEKLPPERVRQLEQSIAGLHGEAVLSDRAVTTYADKWLQHQRAQVEAGQMTAARAANNRTCLDHFLAFLGPASDITGIDADRIDAFYQHVLGKIRKGSGLEGWSVAYAKDVFSVARSFIRYSAARCGACQLPRNIDDKYKFGSPVKRVLTWNPLEYGKAVSEAPGKLKLCLLLMANCGMTQQDVSDLLDEEVDWDRGYITRKRSKTRDKENVPTVSYRLWPETLALLQAYRSGTERVLLTEGGQPYIRTTLKAGGKLSKADGFASNYVHLKKRLGFDKPLKQVRKLSATTLARHETYGRFASYFLGHSPRTVADRHYVIPPQELFDEAVLWLGRRLGQVAN